MKILNKVTVASLKKNKVRTVVTIIGIILSTAMFTAVTTSLSSLKNYMLEVTIADEGAWEGSFYGIGEDVYREVVSAKEVDRAIGIYEIGYMAIGDSYKNGDEALEWSNASNPYLHFCTLDGDLAAAQELGNFTLIEGRMPENENEILLSEDFVNYGKQKLKIGDTITGELGYREYEGEILTGHDWLVKKDAPGSADLEDDEDISDNPDLDGSQDLDGNIDLNGNQDLNENFDLDESQDSDEKLNSDGSQSSGENQIPMGEQAAVIDTPKSENSAKGQDLYSEHLVTDGRARTYTIVGVCSYTLDYYSTPGYAVFCGADFSTAKLLSQNQGINSVYFTVKDQNTLFDFIDRYKASVLNCDYHSHLLYMNGISRTSSFSNVYFGLGTILCIIIVFGSVALIYNAFSISVNERIKQFGLLASIGATKRQLRQSVLFEACVVSIFGIPLGIGAGILGMSVTFYALRYRFTGLISSATVPFSMHVEIWALVVAAVLAFLTVLISAILPARKAMRISAIEAIRQNSEIRVNRKAVRTKGFLHKLFGMEGTLADKNFRRNKKKYRATVISLFVSIVLFVSASSFVEYLKNGVDSVVVVDNYNYHYYVYQERGYTAEEVRDAIAPVEGVTQVFKAKTLHDPVLTEKEFLSEQYLDWAEQSEYYSYEASLAAEQTGRDRLVLVIFFYFMQDDEYIAYTKENNLTELGWFSEKKGALVFDGIREELPGNRYTQIDTLKEKSGIFTANSYDISYDKDVERGGRQDRLIENETLHLPYTVVDAKPPAGINKNYVSFVYPISAFFEIPEMNSESIYMSDIVYVNGEGNLTELYERICAALNAQGISSASFHNIAERYSYERNIIVIINVFSYGFIVLISLIAAANVFNTVSTNISLRRRELAMLESIGMTKKGLYKMLNYECLLYGIKSLCYGLPAATLVTFAIYRVVNEGFVQDFYVPAANIFIAVLSVFVVVFSTMFYSVVKLEKNSLVDTLKNENV